MIKKVCPTEPSVKDSARTPDTHEPSYETVDPYLESLGALIAQGQDAGGITKEQVQQLKEKHNGHQ